MAAFACTAADTAAEAAIGAEDEVELELEVEIADDADRYSHSLNDNHAIAYGAIDILVDGAFSSIQFHLLKDARHYLGEEEVMRKRR